MKKSCPNCGVVYDWYVSECPTCHVALLYQEQSGEEDDQDADGQKNSGEPPAPDADFVVVFSTTDPGLVPLAEIALDQAGIEYVIRNAGVSDLVSDRGVSLRDGRDGKPFELGVRTENEARARELLDDLTAPGAAAAPPVPAVPAATPVPPSTQSRGAIQVVEADTGTRIGEISDAQFDMLTASLEDESLDEWEYYVDEPTLALLQDRDVDAAVIDMLRRALGGREGIDVRCVRNA